MNALLLTLFVSAVIVFGFLLLFARTVRARTFDHSERLALLPLEEPDDAAGAPATGLAQNVRVSPPQDGRV